MKQNLLKLALAGIALAPLAANAAEGTPHHKMYGFFQYNEQIPNHDWGFCSMWTDAYDMVDEYTPVGAELLYPYSIYKGTQQQLTGVIGIYAGAAIDGIYYAPQYEFSNTTSPAPAPFVSHNMITGERKELGSWTDNYMLNVQDMTYDVKNKKLYALTFDLGRGYLAEVDPATGSFKNVCQLSTNSLGTLAADINGNLYAIGQDGWLYKVNKKNGQCTQVYDTDLSGMPSGQTMEFDKTDGSLYWCSNTYGYRDDPDYPEDSYYRSYMIRFTFNEKGAVESMENLGEIGERAVMRAMYIPYVAAGDDAPAAPQNVKYDVASDGTRSVKISWTNPTSTFGGKNLADLTSVTVTRDDEVIKTFDAAEIGANMEYTDNGATEDKEYKYAVYATNSVGDGERALNYQYVGLDAPEAPQNVYLKVADGAQGATITWDAPKYGAHGNKIDPNSVTYEVWRTGSRAALATDLKECRYEDNNIARLGKYTYTVIAKNAVGQSSAESGTWVLGPATDVNEDTPWEEDFEDSYVFNNHWIGVDANGDAYSWSINSTAPSSIVGDGYENGAVYIVNPTYTPSDVTGADEWLISPPLNIEDDDDYVVELHARCFTPENLAVTCASRNLPGDQKTLANLVLTPTSKGTDGTMPFVKYVVDLPKEAGIKCVGLHLTTPGSNQRNTFLQINYISVRHKIEGEETGITSVKAGGNGTEEYYNASGMKLSAPQKGLNIVKTADGRIEKRFVK